MVTVPGCAKGYPNNSQACASCCLHITAAYMGIGTSSRQTGWSMWCRACSNLLRIGDERKYPRPIAFIARGLGGAIVKKAFLLPPDRSVLLTGSRDQINPLIFFETSHRPDDSSTWDDRVLNLLFAGRSSTSHFWNISSRARNLIRDVEETSAQFSNTVTRRHSSVSLYQQHKEHKGRARRAECKTEPVLCKPWTRGRGCFWECQ
ncbi:hypothetical protein QBC34DRAFT_390659 [Podospora aff. communis PSN243]|uniref:Uncharacterized protein n=1 Tax=Podospora aff. communis PSN243 TaxID=3040156 RepID=A0AAV9H7E1_9PEZI|nr:hypothetical protein QBC34DRAFT_390659 [Podospora aff. communis PSN243]